VWISPNHPDPPRQSAPPEDDGIALAEFNRGSWKRLRVRLKTYEGNPYVSLQLFEKDWPVKGRTLSIRLREVNEVIAALERAVELAETIERPVAKPTRQHPPQRHGGVNPPFDPGSTRSGYRSGFDECN
jgi:hypothetical protein